MKVLIKGTIKMNKENISDLYNLEFQGQSVHDLSHCSEKLNKSSTSKPTACFITGYWPCNNSTAVVSLCIPALKTFEQANSYCNPLVRFESVGIDLNWASQPLTLSIELRKGAWVSVTAAVLHKHTIN